MTILGHHTIAELDEWIQRNDAMFKTINAQLMSIVPKWVAKDPTAATDWTNDWKNFGTRYQSARTKAEIMIAANPSINALTPAEDMWVELNKSITSTYPDSPAHLKDVPKGDFWNMMYRVGQAGYKINPAAPVGLNTNDYDSELSNTITAVQEGAKGGANTTTELLYSVGFAALGIGLIMYLAKK